MRDPELLARYGIAPPASRRSVKSTRRDRGNEKTWGQEIKAAAETWTVGEKTFTTHLREEGILPYFNRAEQRLLEKAYAGLTDAKPAPTFRTKGTPIDAPAEDLETADELVPHIHPKYSGGTVAHAHPDAAPGHNHSHPLRLLPTRTNGLVDAVVEAGVRALELDFERRDLQRHGVQQSAAAWDVKEAEFDGQTGLTIRGYASTWTEDRDGDTVARNAFDESLKTYLDDNPVLLLDHKREQVLGQITKAKTDSVGLAVEAFIPKPEADEEKWKITAYRDIKRGLRKALSIGGVFHRTPGKSAALASSVIERVDLYEISNIAVPSNPKSLFVVTSEKAAVA